jgi:hypothetical protein
MAILCWAAKNSLRGTHTFVIFFAFKMRIGFVFEHNFCEKHKHNFTKMRPQKFTGKMSLSSFFRMFATSLNAVV